MFKKKTYGAKPKPRTKLEVDQDYTNHAVQAGHKLRMIRQLQEQVEEHTTKLVELNDEGMKLPPDPPAETAPQGAAL